MESITTVETFRNVTFGVPAPVDVTGTSPALDAACRAYVAVWRASEAVDSVQLPARAEGWPYGASFWVSRWAGYAAEAEQAALMLAEIALRCSGHDYPEWRGEGFVLRLDSGGSRHIIVERTL